MSRDHDRMFTPVVLFLQGLVVRKLKTEKAEKSLIDTEVSKLLELKKSLALAQGIDPSKQTGGSGGKKKKNKK